MNYLDGLTKGGVDYELRDSRIVPDLDNVDNIIYSNFETEEIANKAIASFDDGADTVPVVELKASIESTQDLHGQASPYPAGGSKNLVPLTVDEIKIHNTSGTWSGNAFSSSAGVVFTIQTDNANNVIGILVNGTATSNVFFSLGSILNADIPASAVVNGCPSGGAAFSTYQISINDSVAGTTPVYDIGNGATFAKSVFSENANAVVFIRIGNGTTVNNLVFKPMVRDASITDATFAPYSNICPIYSQAEKNVLPFDLDTIKSLNTSGTWSGNSYTYRTVVCTVKEDGELEISGTATGGDFDIVYGEVELSAVPYILSSGALVGNASYLQLLATGISDINTKSGEKTFTPPAVTATARVHINSGTTVNALCSPMLRSAANPDPTFVPYRCVTRVDEYGKNLLKNHNAKSITMSGVTFTTHDDGSLTATGTATANVNYQVNFIDVIPKITDNVTLSLGSGGSSSCYIKFGYIRIDGSAVDVYKQAGADPVTFTIPEEAYKYRAYIRVNNGTTLNNAVLNPQLEVGTEATDYEAFKDRTYFSLAKNVWDEEWELKSFNTSSHTWDDTVPRVASKDYIPVSPSTRYCFTTNNDGNVIYYDSDKNYISYTGTAVSGGYWSFVTPDNCGYIMFQMFGAYGNTYNNDIAILNAPPEIYGGELNVTTGELTVEKASKTLTSADYAGYHATNKYATFNSSFATVSGASVLTEYTSNVFTSHANSDLGNMSNEYSVNGSHEVVIRIAGGFASAQDAKDYVDNNTVQIVAPLTTPQIFHIDPVEIKTWLANNNITVNTGDIIKLDYRVSPQITKSRELTDLNQKILAVYPQDTASGSIASFPDGAENVPVKELTADITPIQDLHGQASPYPENGGKNKLPLILATIKAANTSGTWSGNAYTLNGVTFTVQTDNGGNVIGIGVNGTASANTNFTLIGNNAGSGLKAGQYKISFTVSGTIGTIFWVFGGSSSSIPYSTVGRDTSVDIEILTDNATLGYCLMQAQSGQSYSGVLYPMIRLSTEADATFAPYSNICPISGYTGAVITRTGRNFFDPSAVTWTEGKYINNTGGENNASNYKYGNEYFKISPNTEYTIQINKTASTDTVLAVAFYDADKNYISRETTSNTTATGVQSLTFTTPVDTAFYRIAATNKTGTTDIQIEVGSTATAYEAYNATVYSVSWTDEGTVYKGTAKYKGGGEWEITDLVAADDMGTLTWTYNESNQRMTATLPTSAESTGGGRSVKDLLSSMFEADITSDIGDNGKMFRNGQAIYVYTDETDPDAFKTAVTGQTLLYPLATPTTFTVSGPDPETLLGDNNIWSDTGDISVKYRANVALYVDKKISEI